jgi:predicted lysophospholipase L1 biosynthesis ABC-type transport system permease subunit
MKEIHEYEKDLASIRSTMARSEKFISLSGMSGILAGCYAIGGAVAAYFLAYYPISPTDHRLYTVSSEGFVLKLLLIGVIVLIASLATGFWLSSRKAGRTGTSLWNATSRQLLMNVSIPLITGGIFILILLHSGLIVMAAASSLLFYGLALIQGSSNTFDEVRYLGFCEIGLGLVSAFLPGYELIFWSLGFGVLHIVYGAILYNKYER